jgi:hypothetical protein
MPDEPRVVIVTGGTAGLALAAEQDNAAVVRRYWDLVWNNGDLLAIEELVEDDFTLHVQIEEHAATRNDLLMPS